MTRNTQRFRRIGEYDLDQLLKDLRDLEAEFLGVKDGIDDGSLQGPPGPPGVKGEPGDRSTVPGPTGPSGTDAVGTPGESAYEIAVRVDGFDGTEQDFLDSLVGKSAYDLAVENGFTGTLEQWLAGQVRDDWGFIDTDWGLITDPVTGTEDYGLING